MILLDVAGHLVSTASEADLHAFARRLGLRRAWFQPHPRHPHYDLTTDRARRRALDAGAQNVSRRGLVRALSACRRCRPPDVGDLVQSLMHGELGTVVRHLPDDEHHAVVVRWRDWDQETFCWPCTLRRVARERKAPTPSPLAAPRRPFASSAVNAHA